MAFAAPRLRKVPALLATGAMAMSAVLGGSGGHAALAADSGPEFQVADYAREVVFDTQRDSCDPSDIPDAPARAFRDATGKIHFFATHEVGRASMGNSFEALAHSCKVAYVGKHLDDYGDFSDREWLTAFQVGDDNNVYAVLHNEYWGHTRKSQCHSGSYMKCWWNTVTFATSTDGGNSFTRVPGSASVIAALPYSYESDFGRPVGYFQPSNIVARDGYYYMLLRAERYREQPYGTCVLRTRDISKPSTWRAWDGQGFNALLSPVGGFATDHPQGHVCANVGNGKLFDTGSLSYDSAHRVFVALTSIPHGSGNKYTPPGVYYSLSADLVNWSDPKVLATEVQLRDHDSYAYNSYGFYSLIDEGSGSREFSTIDGYDRLYLYYVETDGKHAPLKRILVKVRINGT